MYNVKKPEFEAMISREAPQRYEYFLKRVADSEVLFGLRNEDGWVLYGDADGNELFPVWPHKVFADACATGEWSDCEPSAIAVDRFVDEWLPNLVQKKKLVAVFPTPNSKGVPVEATQLGGDLEVYLAQYE